MRWHGTGVQVRQANCQAASAAARKRNMHSTRGATRRQLHRLPSTTASPPAQLSPRCLGVHLSLRQLLRQWCAPGGATWCAQLGTPGLCVAWEWVKGLTMLARWGQQSQLPAACAVVLLTVGCSVAQAHEQTLNAARPQNCKGSNSHRCPRIPLPCLAHARPLLHNRCAVRRGGVCTMLGCLHSCPAVRECARSAGGSRSHTSTPLPAPSTYQGPVEAALAPPPPAHAPAAALPGRAAPRPPHVRPPLRT